MHCQEAYGRESEISINKGDEAFSYSDKTVNK